MPLDPLPPLPSRADAALDSTDTPPPDARNYTRRKARAAFLAMARDVGKTVYRMPVSCDLYLRQYLAKYDEERMVLSDAMRRGVPDRIAKYSPGDQKEVGWEPPSGKGKRRGRFDKSAYEEFLHDEADTLARATGCEPATAWWVVESWAVYVGRPVGHTEPQPVVTPVPTGPEVSDNTLKVLMAAIAAFGGFVGGFLGNGIGTLALVVSDAAVENYYSNQAITAGHIAVIVVVLVIMFIGGVAGAIGAFGGWLMGRGDQKPWAGFAAAVGAAFPTGCLAWMMTGPGIGAAIAICVATFGAVYTTASRGGYKT